MRPFARALVLLLVLTSSAQAAPPLSAETLRQRRESKARYDRKVAEMKRWSDERWKELQARQAKINEKMKQDFEKEFAARHPSSQLPPFDPAKAPPPADCLRAFVAAAKSATRMEQVLPYLPVDNQQVLIEEQKHYDPKDAAASRAWFKKQDPKIDEASLTYLSNPPFVNELNRNKDIAGGILEVLSVKVEGNKALIEVSTTRGGTFNDVYYPYGTAKVELTGEAGYWKLSSYNDSNVIYMQPPQASR